MKSSTKDLLDGLLAHTPAQPVFAHRASRSLAVLAYHEVNDPARFELQLDHLVRVAHPVTLEEVVTAVERRAPLPERAVLLTFDDGHRDVVETVLPLLRERGIPAVAFVVAGLIGSDDAHWWTEVKELSAAGGIVAGFDGTSPPDLVRALKRVSDARRLAAIEELRRRVGRSATPVAQLRPEELSALESAGIAVGNHSLTHPCLSRCTDEKILHEVRGAHDALSGMLGHEPTAFAYPDGDQDPRVTRIVEEVGYPVAFRFDHRLDDLTPRFPLGISRLRTDAHATLDRFRIIVSGLHPAIHRLRGLA
jgi:peptidoglycan/xylan/chitin deacetylase (PgdA/CDA1 family)